MDRKRIKKKVSMARKNIMTKIQRAQKRIRQASEEIGLSVAEIKDINRRMSIGEAKARRAKKIWLKPILD